MSDPVYSYKWDYTRRIVSTYERTGDCNGCGICCTENIQVLVLDRTDKGDPRDGADGTDQKGVWWEIRNEKGERRFYGSMTIGAGKPQCPYLNGQKRCNCYSRRPTYCRVWPMSPYDTLLFRQCSYSFRLVKSERF